MRKELTDDEVKAEILMNLIRGKYFGGKHTDIRNAAKGIDPQHLGKRGHKRIDKLVREMIRQGFIVPKPTSYGFHISLNPGMAQEIKIFIKSTLGYDLRS